MGKMTGFQQFIWLTLIDRAFAFKRIWDTGSRMTGGQPNRHLWLERFASVKLLSKLLGRPLRTKEAQSETIGVVAGVAVLGLDGLSSAAYGPEAAMMILMPLGAGGMGYVFPILGAIILLLGVLFFSYRQTISAYPNGGGSYTVAKENLGANAGLFAASSLLIDYLLNVAVGISAGVAALQSAIPAVGSHRLAACLVILVFLTFLNLRGVRESGMALSLPTYAFVITLLITLGIGVWKTISSGGHPVAVTPPPAIPAATAPFGWWLIIRSFASGCTAMTGVEAVSNGVPLFKDPAPKNAERSLALIVALLAVLLAGVGFLAKVYHLGAFDQDQANYQSVLSQLVGAIAGRGIFYYVTLASILAVLTLSANTSFAGFPRLCRLLAEDGFLPVSFANLGRRLFTRQGSCFSSHWLAGSCAHFRESPTV